MAITTKVVPSLNSATTYYFNVLVKDTSGNEAAYTKKQEATLEAAPVAGNTGTITATNIQELQITLNWTKATDDVSSQANLQYLAYKSTNATLSSVADIESNGVAVDSYAYDINTKVVPLSNAGTTYYFNVIVKDEAGNKTAYTKLTQATADTTPPSVAVGTITLSSVISTGCSLNWTKATDNVSEQANLQYLAYYSTNPTLSSVGEIEANGTAVGTYAYDINTKAVADLTSGTNYYCNVIVKDLTGNKAPYTKVLLSLDIVAPTPGDSGTIAIPSETAKANEVILNWTKATDDLAAQAQIQYLVYYSTNSAMDSVSDVKANGTPFGTWTYDINTKTVTGLTAGTTYYFNVLIRDMGSLSGMLGANETAYGKQQYITPSLDVSIASTVPDTGTTMLSLIPFTVTFELAGYPLNDSTFLESDITVTNGTVDTGSLTGTGTSWSFDVVPTLAGEVTVEIQASKVQDTNSNNNTQSNLWTFTYTTSIDITTLGRFVLGLPRDVDVSTNTVQVLSLKVGTTTPAELTEEMADLLVTTYTPGQGLPGANVSTGAKQDILETKMVALRDPVLAWTPTTGNTSDVVTTEVLAIAQVDVPVGAGNPISAANAWGIFVGTVAGASDMGKVLVRLSGTDNGIEDGNGDEVYGVLSESGGVYTLSYKKSDGTAYTILAADTTAKMDFFFVEIQDLYSFTVDSLLFPPIGGVVDHTTGIANEDEVTARMNADITLQLNIDAEITARRNADNVEITARRNADSTIQNLVDVEASARLAADSTLQTLVPPETTARMDADSTIQANILAEKTSRLGADSTLQANINLEVTARSDADSTLQSNINLEVTARSDADSTIQANILVEKTSRLNADSTLQLNLNTEITSRTNADSTIQSSIDDEATARSDADSTIQSNLDGEVTARSDADSTLLSNLDGEVTARQDADSTIQSGIDGEATARSDADSTIQSGIDDEATARSDADSTLQSNLDIEITARINGDLAGFTEATARMNADSTLQANLNTEITARLDGDSTLTSNLNTEITARLDGDSTLTSNLNTEITARLDGDSTLTSNLNTEITARLNGDSTLTSNLNTEITGRQNADSTLQGNLDTETTARMDADSTLLANINNLNMAVIDVSFTAEENISAGNVVFESKGTAGQVKLANATGIATCETIVGVAIETKTTGQAIMIRTFGEATTTTDGTNFDVGKRVYVALVNGQATKTAPSGESNVVYLLGGATATNKVSINHALEYLVEGSFMTELGAGMEAMVGAGGEGVSPAT